VGFAFQIGHGMRAEEGRDKEREADAAWMPEVRPGEGSAACIAQTRAVLPCMARLRLEFRTTLSENIGAFHPSALNVAPISPNAS
jgi:hypothetical protein